MTAPLGVPVFNCVVNVAHRNAEGEVVATVANLAGVSARGKSEREALAAVVSQFKSEMARHQSERTPIPWIDPPRPPAASETQRLIAVHL
jgi:predicted RNase H-like HicB family nuclease